MIAALNEASRIEDTIRSAEAADAAAEIIVVDGGSEDRTPNLAARAGAKVISAARGRGSQLAAGVAVARGDIVVFLHADTRFPKEGARALRSHLLDAKIIGGNFRVLFDGGDGFSDWLNGFYAWFRVHGLYYGDSVIFVRRAALRTLGGIRPLALMEDYDLCRRMERHGGTVCIEEVPVITSARRFRGRRPAAIFTQWVILHLLFYAQFPSRWLSRLYDSERRRTAS